MKGLTTREQETIRKCASEIYSYKCMLSIAYYSISEKAQDEITRKLLAEVYTNERSDAEDWL